MNKWWRLTQRARMLLTLELAIVLPAAALIGVSVWNLRSIQRDRAVEAAIHRDFSEVLRITEKKAAHRILELAHDAREQFPCPEDAVVPKLDRLLEARPHLAHVFFYSPKTGMILRSRAGRQDDSDLHKELEMLAGNLRWVKMEAKEMAQRIQKMDEKDGMPFYFYGHTPPRGEKWVYQNFFVTTVKGWPSGEPVLAGGAFDADWLSQKFFPDVFRFVLAKEADDAHGSKANGNPTVMMVRLKKETAPLAASAGWDGGTPEVERNFEGILPGLTLAMKYRGTTVAALNRRFLRNNFLMIGALSLLLAAGIWHTWRNIAREIAVAKLKSDFVANVSHELRTPLALLRLYAETLEMGRLSAPEKFQEYYRIMRKESERLTALINNILDFSRIEAGRKEYDFRETNLAELVRQTLESYRFQIEQNGFAFEERIADDLPTVQVDREAIARSLLNLVNNALKYSPQEKYIGVNVYRTNGTVKLEVVDRGIGIPRSEQSKIFEKFYRVGDPLVHNTKGSGLGLSLVRHIVQAHGGQIAVESAPGQGSKFTISLPVNGALPAAAA
jgi:signal transduction histidine kinase